MKGVLLFVLLMLSAVWGIYYASLEDESNLLTVGIETAFPPFEMLNSSGELIGFDIEVIKQLSYKLKKKVRFVMMPFDNLILSLVKKKVDIIMGGISITEHRKSVINLVHYSGNCVSTMPLVFWKENFGIKTMDDFAQLEKPVISVQSGSIQKDWIASFSCITVHQLETISELILNLKQGKCTACVIEPTVLSVLSKKYPELNIVMIDLPKDQHIYGYGIGVAQSNKQLTNDINKAIGALKNEGVLKRLEETWFSP